VKEAGHKGRKGRKSGRTVFNAVLLTCAAAKNVALMERYKTTWVYSIA